MKPRIIHAMIFILKKQERSIRCLQNSGILCSQHRDIRTTLHLLLLPIMVAAAKAVSGQITGRLSRDHHKHGWPWQDQTSVQWERSQRELSCMENKSHKPLPHW